MAPFFFLLLICFVPRIAYCSPLEQSHLARVLEIQERERVSPSVQIATVRSLLGRLLPSHQASFEFEIIPKAKCGGKACFIINNHPSSGIKGSPEILYYLDGICQKVLKKAFIVGEVLYRIGKNRIPEVNTMLTAGYLQALVYICAISKDNMITSLILEVTVLL
ncbi:hypothetical protein COCNU_11G008600 [Cocos nucifera]|uniref:Uncharacterized protein n=1 Tax=Cocos nucifera TaxID=13894 RepID=A0A8K0IQ22_COCNU|nr:hypothetical protein COCNU_11G008600 [Cocos nucifera]